MSRAAPEAAGHGAVEARLAAALLDARLPVPEAIADGPAPGRERFAIYRNAVVTGLVEALEARFPVVARLVGQPFFAAMARVYATGHPPRSRLMAAYGDGFPDFLATFEPVAGLPYLPDVARIESARVRAYHAADARPLTVEDWSGIDAAAAGALRVELHPSLTVIRSAYPAATIWATNQPGREPEPVRARRAEAVAVARPREAVAVTPIPIAEARFLDALARSRTLAEAAETAAAPDPSGPALAADAEEFDLTRALSTLLRGGLAVALHPPALRTRT